MDDGAALTSMSIVYTTHELCTISKDQQGEITANKIALSRYAVHSMTQFVARCSWLHIQQTSNHFRCQREPSQEIQHRCTPEARSRRTMTSRSSQGKVKRQEDWSGACRCDARYTPDPEIDSRWKVPVPSQQMHDSDRSTGQDE